MSAPTGNKYAEKWTLERTLITLNTIDRYSQGDDVIYLGHALYNAGVYDDIWRYWRRKWRDRYEILHMMNVIMHRFEVRLFNKMAKKEIPERVGMFALRHHYGWGKEPKEGVYEDLSYLDREPIHEDLPKPETQITQQPEEEPQPLSQKNQTPSHPLPFYKEDFILLKRLQYNTANPQNKIVDPLPYYDGTPPDGIPAIIFDKGYFLKQ